jgi:hypothetical protein
MCCHRGSGDLLGFASRLLIEMAHFCAFGCHGSTKAPALVKQRKPIESGATSNFQDHK